MGRVRSTIAATMVGAAIAAQGAGAQEPPAPPPPDITAPPPDTFQEQPVVVGPPKSKPKPPAKPKGKPAPSKGKDGKQDPKPENDKNDKSDQEKGAKNPEEDIAAAPVAPLPQSCGFTAVPPTLIPIYQAASEKYDLGAAGPSILAAINEIESGFGQNLGPSSAGALGWMQFMPSTWDAYGVDADGDGKADPNDPEDAIFAAARYLRAGGMPEDPEGAIFAYNHADWYVADVLARAACFSGIGNGSAGSLSLIPTHQQLACEPAEDTRESIPEDYLKAIQDAAGRYELGEDGVWAMAAVARLESDFGRGMTKEELELLGPFGITDENWAQFAVDGDGDGKPTRESPADSAATLARMLWASGTLKAGLFQHNHASWYVNAVLEETDAIAGKCKTRTTAYAVALPGPMSIPINWANVELSNSLEMWDLQRGAVDPRIVGVIGAISQEHKIRISSLRSDHDKLTNSGNVSNHYFGRAVDISAIDGVPCTVTDLNASCGVIARSLAALPAGQKPTELIYCFDPDGPAPEGFAAADHCDHIHVGFNE
jgi:Transglycosylase SLT domain